MCDHPSISQLAHFCARSLSVPELTDIAEHVSICADCRQSLPELLHTRSENPVVSFGLSDADWFRDVHFEYTQLKAFAENNLDHEDLAILNAHLETCVRCRVALKEFLKHHQINEAELEIRVTLQKSSAVIETAAPV